MKTPITDKAFADAAKVNPSPSLMKLGILARRLELDRAALMEALSSSLLEHRNVLSILQNRQNDGEAVGAWAKITKTTIAACESALSAARANFPD